MTNAVDRPAPDQVGLHLACELLIASAERDGSWRDEGSFGSEFEASDFEPGDLLDGLLHLGGRMAYLLAAGPWCPDTPRAVVEHLAMFHTIYRAVESARSPEPQEDPMPIRKDRLAAAREEIDRQEATVARWEVTRTTKAAELADLERRIGAELVDAEDPDVAMAAVHDSTSRLRSDIASADRTIETATARLDDALRSCLRAAAADCRRQARDKRFEAAKRARRTAELLDELEAHEGVRYQAMALVHISSPTRVGTDWAQATTQTDRLGHDADRLDQHALEGELLADRPGPIERADWIRTMAKLDPEGAEATGKAERLAAEIARAEQHRAAEDAAHERRREWIAKRTDELLTQPGPWNQTPTAEGKRMVAERQAKQEYRERGQVPAA